MKENVFLFPALRRRKEIDERYRKRGIYMYSKVDNETVVIYIYH